MTNFNFTNKLFFVGGATSGFGLAVAIRLLNSGANIIANARGVEKLYDLKNQFPNQVQIFVGDLSDEKTMNELFAFIGTQNIYGALINAGGPPAKTVLETTLEDWDDAYKKLLRWKVLLTQHLAKKMIENKVGRLVFIESSSVKQPLENLVLSNSLRMAVVGFVKTLSAETASTGLTLNIIAPGSHNTPAIDRIYNKKSEQTGLPFEKIKAAAIDQIPVKKLGEADDLASLACWLFSNESSFITGQTISVDGGAVKSSFG